MASRHTNGPWKIGAPSKSTGRTIWRNDPGQDPNADDFRNDGWARICSHVNREADAHLIAAAPELYDALEEILAIAEAYEDVIDGPISVRPNPYMRIADNARAAIQKAANGD